MKFRSVFIMALNVALMYGCKEEKPNISKWSEAEQIMLKKEGHEEFFYWQLEDDKSLWEPISYELQQLKEYEDTLKLILGDEKWNQTVQKEATQELDSRLILQEDNGDKINALMVHTGTVGEVRKMNMIEAHILNYQMSRFPMFTTPTEFHAFIATNRQLDKVRIYFGSSNTRWPPKAGILLNELEKELSNGWKLKGHLHNHYSESEGNYVGILAPSLADAQYYKFLQQDFDMQLAFITNGFHSVTIDSSDFDKFESH